jgi:hypothetical protein
MVPSIRHPNLQRLLRTAASLPGPKMNLAPLTRLPPSNAASGGGAPAGAAPATSSDPADPSPPVTTVPAASTSIDPAARAEIARVRAMVGTCLAALARTIDQHLGPAIENAHRAWEQVDDLAIVDTVLAANVTETRRALYRAATAPGQPALAAVGIEGLLALDAACGLTGLAERRLSSLIRLRVRSAEPALLPQGRPFLDLGRAIAEVAREWS